MKSKVESSGWLHEADAHSIRVRLSWSAFDLPVFCLRISNNYALFENMKKIITAIVMLLALVTSSYAQDGPLTVYEVFGEAAKIEGLEKTGEAKDGFPKEIGKPEMIVHPNAESREAVLALLARLPEGALVYDDTDERGKFDCLYFDRDALHLLYVHMGLGGNDSVIILFRVGDKDSIDRFLDNL